MTAHISLTNGKQVLVDASDHAKLSNLRWQENRGRGHTSYAVTYDRSLKPARMVTMHRLIVGAADGEIVDHVNGNGLDNRRANLRICNHAENMRNRARRNGGFKGVEKMRGKYRARIMADGKCVALGSFETEVEAAVAYDRAAIELHQEFASLNFNASRDWLFVHDHEPLQHIREGRS